METNLDLQEANGNWRTKTLVAGVVLGALVGLGGAYLLVQNAEKHGQQVSVSARDGLKLSLILMGLLRQVAQLGDGE